MIYFIYSPTERIIADMIAAKVAAATGHDCKFAPVGIEALSEPWKQQVTADIDASAAVVIVMSDESLTNESVIWRIEQTLTKQKRIVPVLWGKSYFPSPSQIDSRIEALTRFNFLFVPEEYQAEALERLVRHLPVEHITSCFLSYSRSDADFTARLAADLRAAGLRTWRDAENIPAGANWDREIEKALTTCSHVLLVATPRSVASENVLDEVGLALNREKPVIPLMVETCDLPLRVHRAQWVDFRADYAAALKQLLSQLGVEGFT